MGGINSEDEVELFLKNMFLDRHILPINPILRRFIANRIVSKRADEVRANLREYLNGKSPLLDITNRLIDKISKRVDIPVRAVMRYVPPFAIDILEELKEMGVGELILFPMYPQYSTTTTLSSIEDIRESAKRLGYSPDIRVIEPYYDDFTYISLIVKKILETIDINHSKDYDLILSAHSIPMSIIKRGDPYEKQIEANLSALKTYLKCRKIEFKDIKLAYQSKVGNAKWLEPNLVDILRNPTNRRVIIYPLSFTIDNSETIFELGVENREIANKLKYIDYRVVECFNDDDEFVDFIINRSLGAILQ